MTPRGFVITYVALTGINVPTADVIFRPGLNVVSGPSDTGKTFIAQCIDFGLGAGSAPKEIPQAVAYESVVIRLRPLVGGDELELRRSLRGGDITLTRSGHSIRTLRAKHRAEDPGTVSRFLLELCGLDDKRIR